MELQGILVVVVGVLACGCTVGAENDSGFASSQTGASSPSGPSSGDATGDGDSGQDADADATADTGSSSQTSPTSGDPTSGETEPTASETGDESASSTGGESTGNELDGTPLDPNLDIPEEGQSCDTPGNMNECPFLEVCRFYTVEESKCEGCDACGNLNAPCVNGTDCDILFACYAGRCTNICPLGTSYCGPVEDCLDVGHASHGVCDPFA